MGRQKNVADSYYSGGKIAEAKYDWIQKKRQFFLFKRLSEWSLFYPPKSLQLKPQQDVSIKELVSLLVKEFLTPDDMNFFFENPHRYEDWKNFIFSIWFI